MAYTKTGKYYDEKLYYVANEKLGTIVPRYRNRPVIQDFSLNFRINGEDYKKFSDYCEKEGTKKSTIMKKILVDIVENGVKLKKFEKFKPLKPNDKNAKIILSRRLYDSFVEKCHEKGYKDASKVLRSIMVCVYSEKYEEVSEKV